ncbi:MAG: hypothetical protein A2Y23_03580 [Clostridiales bacterium GWB2_37_7]|nr:MAG: hypothetical protein A2Y23_03580 [Clostridiales bacterium GWB2_37_7]
MIDYTAATPVTYFYILDVHGNVVALADETGNKVVSYEYDAWGLLTNTPEAVTTGNGELLRNANPFRYSSYQFDPESGLYYLKARYYTSTLGRFLTRDRVLVTNLYEYAKNNPINNTDPDGDNPLLISMGIGAALGAIISAGTNVATQFAVSKGFRKINLSEVGVAAVGGAVSGALAGSGIGLVYPLMQLYRRLVI